MQRTLLSSLLSTGVRLLMKLRLPATKDTCMVCGTGRGRLPSLCRNTRLQHLEIPTKPCLVMMYTGPRFITQNLQPLYIAASLSFWSMSPLDGLCTYLGFVVTRESLHGHTPTNGIVLSECFRNMVVKRDDVYYTNHTMHGTIYL